MRAAGRKESSSSSNSSSDAQHVWWEKENCRVAVNHGSVWLRMGGATGAAAHRRGRQAATKIATTQKASLSPPLSLPPLPPLVAPSGYCEAVSMEMWVRAAPPLMLQPGFGCGGSKPQ